MTTKTNITRFSVGICAFNEEENIGNLLTAILYQKLPLKIALSEIIVITSGCTDNTENIVKDFKKKNKKIILISQKEREGKAIAVNIFLSRAKEKLLILQSADTIPTPTCYSYLLKKLKVRNVGLVAGRIIPKDDPETFLGFANHLKWSLHHQINLKYPERPKVGELIAFKKIFEQIPPQTAVDEASIEPLIHLQGFRIVYEPRAIIYNRGPRTLREYLSVRRRIYAGHFITKKKYAYEIITLNSLRIIPIFLSNLKGDPKYLVYAFATAILELIGRLTGYIDVKFKIRDHAIWKIAPTSKNLLSK